MFIYQTTSKTHIQPKNHTASSTASKLSLSSIGKRPLLAAVVFS
jgi:hypothetical protein